MVDEVIVPVLGKTPIFIGMLWSKKAKIVDHAKTTAQAESQFETNLIVIT